MYSFQLKQLLVYSARQDNVNLAYYCTECKLQSNKLVVACTACGLDVHPSCAGTIKAEAQGWGGGGGRKYFVGVMQITDFVIK